LPSLYIHVPFCERKCPYCAFYSVANAESAEDFLAALQREIRLRRDSLGSSAAYETIFFGGGTPSLLVPRQIETILANLHVAFPVAPDAEVTLEANPGTVTLDSLRALRALGVNRLSVGIQSFRDHDLAALGRWHDGAEALRCLAWARAAGFDNIGIDLIYAIPGQTVRQWEDNLRIATDRAPQHIAAYGLTVEDDTPFARRIERGEIRVAPAEREARMLERTEEVLAARGYDHYEISNYALPGFRCRHNLAYWSHAAYLGFGPSAHSFRPQEDGDHGLRWWNVADLATYTDLLARGRLPVASAERLDERDAIRERILLGLRSGGLDLARLEQDLGDDLEARQTDTIRWMTDAALAIQEGRTIRLTSRGYALCDEICARLCRGSDLGGGARHTPVP
jgi:oxygen-independent coproporphyrinogen-3 oxidase